MSKTNYTENRTLNAENGNVCVQTQYEIPRYEARIYADCQWTCEDVIENLKSEAKIWVGSREYTSLSNISEPEDLTGNLETDLDLFQKQLDEEYGKGEYEAFVLGAYIHSFTSFSINKSGNHVCRFDSSQLGFIGLPVSPTSFYSADNADKVAEELTHAWNGEYNEFVVYDNLNEEPVDSITTADPHEKSDWFRSVEDKYKVSFDDVDPIY